MTNNSENLFLKYKDDFEYCKNVIKITPRVFTTLLSPYH